MFGSYTKKDVGTSFQLVTASENNMNPNFRFNKLFLTCNNGAQDVHTMPCCQIVHDLLSCCLALNKIFSISTYFDHFSAFSMTKKVLSDRKESVTSRNGRFSHSNERTSRVDWNVDIDDFSNQPAPY